MRVRKVDTDITHDGNHLCYRPGYDRLQWLLQRHFLLGFAPLLLAEFVLAGFHPGRFDALAMSSREATLRTRRVGGLVGGDVALERLLR